MSEQTPVTIRAFSPADLASLVGIINASVALDNEPGHTSLEDLRSDYQRPYFNPEQNVLIATIPEGRVADLHPGIGQGTPDSTTNPLFTGFMPRITQNCALFLYMLQ